MAADQLSPKPYAFPEDLPSSDVPQPGTFSTFDATGYARREAAAQALSGPLGQRWEPDYVTVTPAEQAHRTQLEEAHRANSGGLSDSPDDGGPRAVSSKPFSF
jgi:hypothetical protein